MHYAITRYIRNYDTCIRIKPAHYTPYRLLKLLEVSIRQWSLVSLDLITGLPMSNGYDALLVVVDQLSQMAYYIPTTMDITSKELARLYFDYIFHVYGICNCVISNQGTQFVSEFTKALRSVTRTKQNLSTSFHP